MSAIDTPVTVQGEVSVQDKVTIDGKVHVDGNVGAKVKPTIRPLK